MKIIIKYSEEKDLIPYLNSLWKSSWTDYGTDYFEIGKKYFPVELLESIKKSKTKTKIIKLIKKYWLEIRTKNFNKDIHFIIKWYSKILNEEQDLIIKPLEKVYKQKFPFKKITIYLTTFFSCPYNYHEKWYMVQRNSGIVNYFKVSIHELNHFMFYYYWYEYLEKQGFSRGQIEHLKEAFAVLTNDDPKENSEKINVLPIQNFIKANKNKSIKEIIDLVIKSKLLDNIK